MGAYDKIKELLKSKDNSKALLSSINALFKSFSFLNISEEELYSIVSEEIEKTNNVSNIKGSYNKLLLENINNRLTNLTKELLSDFNSSSKILDNFINNNIKSVNNISDTIVYFNKINDIFESCELIPSIDLIGYLIKNNDTFSKMISLVIKHYKSKIVSDEIDEVFDNNTILTSIDVYCDVVDTSIKKEEDEVTEKKTKKDSLEVSLNEYPVDRRMRERPVLTPEKELEVAKRMAEGDKEARDLLIESNMRLVRRIAYKYSYSNLPIEDLYQAGHIGLITAVDKFDYTTGFKFSTFGTWWIRQSITRFIQDNSRTIRLPVHRYEEINELKKVYNQLESELGRNPTVDELAKVTGFSKVKVEELITIQNDIISLDNPIGEDGETDFYEIVPDEKQDPHDVVLYKFLKEELIKLIDNSNLKPDEKNIVKYYFGLIDGNIHTFEETGKKFNKTRQRVDRIVKASLEKLRRDSYAVELASYFGDSEKAKANLITLRSGGSISNKKHLSNLSIYQLIKKPKAKIDNAISNLSEEEKTVIEKRFGDDLENPDFYELSDDEIIIFNNAVKNIKNSFIGQNKRNSRSSKTIYQLIPKYPKKQIDFVISTFSNDKTSVLEKKYGKDFENPVFSSLIDKEVYDFNILVSRIKNRLRYLYGTKGSMSVLNPYQLFSDNTREDVDYVISSFSEDKEELLKKLFGDNYENKNLNDLTPEEYDIIFDKIYPVMSRKLNIILNGGDSKNKTLYEIVGDKFTEEEVDEVIRKLEAVGEDLSLVYKKYGGDLKKPIFTRLNKVEYNSSYQTILKIKRILNEKSVISSSKKERKAHGKSLYVLLGKNGVTKDKIDEAIEKLKSFEEDVSILYVRYGSNLDEPVFKKLEEDEKREFWNVIMKLKKILVNPDSKNNYTKTQVDNVNSNLSRKVNDKRKIKLAEKENNSFEETSRGKSIYQLLPDYTEKQIDDVISIFKSEGKDIQIIYDRYGNDLKNPEMVSLSGKQSRVFYRTVGKLKRRLNKINRTDKQSKNGKKLYQLIKGDYTEEKIDGVIDLLCIEGYDITILFDRYGNDLKNPKYYALTKSQHNDLFKVVSKIQRRLDSSNYSIYHQRNGQTIYDVIKGNYTEEEIDEVIELLGWEGQNIQIIYDRYGNDLKNTIIHPFTSEQFNELNSIVSKIRRRLKSIDSGVLQRQTIYDVIKGDYTEEEINNVIDQLGKEGNNIRLLFDLYGPDLKKIRITLPRKKGSGFYTIIDNIESRLKSLNNKPVLIGETLYESMAKYGYNKKQVEEAIEKLVLAGVDVSILYKRCGPNLDEIVCQLNKEESKDFLSLKRKIQRHIANPNLPIVKRKVIKNKNLYEYMEDFGHNKNQVDMVISNLEDEEVLILKKFFGDTFDKVLTAKTTIEEGKYRTLVLKKMKRELKKLGKKSNYNNTIYGLLPDYTEEQIDKMIEQLRNEGEDFSIFDKRWGSNLKKPKFKSLKKPETKELFVKVKKIKRRLDSQGKKRKVSRVYGKSLYELMKKHNFTSEQVDKAIELLDEDRKEILYKRFDKETLVPINRLSVDERIELNSLLEMIRNRIKNPEKYKDGAYTRKKTNSEKKLREKTIYEMMVKYGYKEEDVDIAIGKLNPDGEFIKILNKRYIGDLKNPIGLEKLDEEEKRIFTKAKKRILNLLKNPDCGKKYGKKYTFYGLMEKNGYSRECVNGVVATLPIVDINKLKGFYGDNFDEIYSDLTKEENDCRVNIINKIKNRLNNPEFLRRSRKIELSNTKALSKKTIYQSMDKYGMNLVNYVISGLNDDEKNVLILRYGYNLIDPIYRELNDDERKEFTKVLAKIRRQLVVVSEEKDLYQLMDGYLKEEVDRVIPSVLSVDDIDLLKKKFGKNYSNKLSKILTEKEKKRLTGVILKRIRSELDNPGSLSQKKLVKSRKTVSSQLKSTDNRKELFNKITKLYDSYTYANVSSEEFDNIVLSSIEQSTKYYNGTGDYNKFLLEIIRGKLSDRVKELINNSDYSFDIIYDYINDNYKKVNSSELALKQFNNIGKFFDLYGYSPSDEVIIELLSKNTIFSNTISLIMKKYKAEIDSGDGYDLTEHYSLLSMISGYFNSDEIEDVEEENSSISAYDSPVNRTIKETPLLSPEEEYEHFKRFAEGDLGVRDTIFYANMRLVKSIAGKYHSNFLSYEDRVSEGFVGLMKAINKYDYTRGFKFSTYATWWIKQAIERAIKEKDREIRVPVHKEDELRKLAKAQRNLSQSLNRNPTYLEIAKEMGVTLEKVWDLFEINIAMRSLDDTIKDDSDATVSYFVPDSSDTPEEAFMSKSYREEFAIFLKSLNLKEREIFVVENYFGFGELDDPTLEQIANRFNPPVTRERVRQIIKKAENTMIQSPKLDDLLDYSEFSSKYKQKLLELRKKLYETGSLRVKDKEAMNESYQKVKVKDEINKKENN